MVRRRRGLWGREGESVRASTSEWLWPAVQGIVMDSVFHKVLLRLGSVRADYFLSCEGAAV